MFPKCQLYGQAGSPVALPGGGVGLTRRDIAQRDYPTAARVRITRGPNAGAVVPVMATWGGKWHRVALPGGAQQWVHRGDLDWLG